MSAGEASDLARIAFDDFARHRGERFELDTGSARVSLELVEAEKLGAPREGHREAFALLFRGPVEPVLPQRIYALTHPTHGRLDVFLVPVGQDAQGTRYELIFN